jgi:pimeloyl-ACP methyl ester carboxylesterase
VQSPPPPAIALVPGFFGFEHRGARTYFADRFVAALRSVLQARGVPNVPVVSVSTLGIGSLVRRQADLLTELRALETPTRGELRLGGPRAWHLVGHSTGGVDAAMLLRDEPLVRQGDDTVFAQGGWGAWADLVERVRSVTTVAAPHFGTGFAESPLARFATGHPSLTAFRDMALATLDLARRGDVLSRVAFARSASPSIEKLPLFLLRMMLRNDLARDLRPKLLAPLSARPVRPSVQGRLFSVVTVAPRPGPKHTDKLFRDMWRWTHDGGIRSTVQPPVSPGLDDVSLRLPCQRHLRLPPIDGGDNDGVVSTQRQVLGEVTGIVVGDHVDVLGRYRRTSLVDNALIDPGLLTSGAEFGDNEFFDLLLRIGERIASVIET